MTFPEYLKSVNACKSAMEWNGDRNLQACWSDCERGDWMLWLMQKAGMCDLQTLTLAKAKCAELVKPFMKDERSIKALQAAFDFAEGRITREELDNAAADADAAAADAYAAAADADADAADAAYAAYAAAADADAAYAAYAAADAAAAAARIKILKQCADICREVLPNPAIEGVSKNINQ